jgi:hypothetical protein
VSALTVPRHRLWEVFEKHLDGAAGDDAVAAILSDDDAACV